MVKRSDGTEAPIIEEHHDVGHSERQVTYGELVILGYNGSLPQGDRGRKRSKFVLHKRPMATGVKRSRHYVVKTPHSSQAILDTTQHSISYTLSRNHAVIVEYNNDEDTDMFQIGRSSETPIDFVVMDTIPGDKTAEMKVSQSTISRFACRILCERNNPKVARIYAAGFDSSRNIFLGLVPHMDQEHRSTRIPRQIRILIALRFFAIGNYQRGIGEELLLSSSQQAVSRCIHEVANCIAIHMGAEWIKFPFDQQSKNDIKTGFMEKAGFPGVIGCIDCTHIAILGPSREEHNYVNRKGFHSKNVQIVCSYNLEILNINARYPGSVNDAFIWRASQVKHVLNQDYNRGERNQWLLGDSGYPLEPWLLTPYENPEPNTPEGHYNRAHKITRSIIERCNGRFKLVFRCLLGERKLRYSPEKVGVIINACAVLHNLLLRAGVEYDIDLNIFNEPYEDNYGNGNYPVLNEARHTRQQVVNRYFTNV